MKITRRALKKLVIEAIEGSKIFRERPWAVEYTFQLSGGKASDSEGISPDGFAITMSSDSGKVVKVIVDSYWNPTSGDESGNSLKIEVDGEVVDSTYVPVRFDTGESQRIVISNAPVDGMMTVSHASDAESPPIMYLAATNPFAESEDVSFSTETIGNGSATVEMTGHTNL